MTKKEYRSEQGLLMLQISVGRFFRPGIALHERTHRRTVYSNAFLLDPTPVELPVGIIVGSTQFQDVSTFMLEAVDRLEKTRPDGSEEFMVATAGEELIDDIAYVMTFVLDRTFGPNHDEVHRLVRGEDSRGGGAAGLLPGLFTPRQVIRSAELDELKSFMATLLGLSRGDFVRAMRVIRGTVEATRRGFDDPTGAYTDLVAALESLGEDHLTEPVTWDRYDGRARKIIDAALTGEDETLARKMRTAVLEAERVGLKRRFVSSTLARISPAYYRDEAVGAVRAPQSADLERMLGLAYDIRSRRGHILEDLGDEAWVFTDGAETVFEPRLQQILTIAGLWRLVRHVVRRFVAEAPQVEAEPWDYRAALPGIMRMQLAPQYWLSWPQTFDVDSAEMWFDGVAEAFISWYSQESTEGIDLTGVVEKIELLVPGMDVGPAKTAMVGIHTLWHAWTEPHSLGLATKAFIDEHGSCLDRPSPVAFAVGLLCDRGVPDWTLDEWVTMASQRRAARTTGKQAPLPAAVDVLLQLETADRLEAAGRHDEAVVYASHAVEERPGDEDLMTWERRLIAGDHDPHFRCHKLLYGRTARDGVSDAAEEERSG